jgi:hypothetical protein
VTQIAMYQYLDQPLGNALIYAILASANVYLLTPIHEGALVDGSASFNRRRIRR